MSSGFRRGALLVLIAAAAFGTLAAALYYGYSTRIGAAVDLFLPWWTLREAWTTGASPYGEAIGLAARAARFYGDPPPPPQHPYRFAYPLHFAFFVAPLLPLPYPWAAAAWMAALALATGAALLLFCDLLGWPSRPSVRALVAVIGAASYPGLVSIVLGQVTPVVLLALLGALMAYRRGRDATAGMLVALATVKPQLVWLAVPLLVVQAARDRRWRMPRSFLAALAALVGLPMLWQPHWPLEFAASLRPYAADEPTPSALLLAAQLLGDGGMTGLWRGGPALAAAGAGALLVALTAVWWWVVRPDPPLGLSAALAVTLLVTPLRAQTTHLALLVPLLWVLRWTAERSRAAAVVGSLALLVGWWALIASRSDPPDYLLRQVVPPLVVLALLLLPLPAMMRLPRQRPLRYSTAGAA